MNLVTELKVIEPLVTNSPLRRLRFDSYNLFAKLEYFNYSGSIKARPAYEMLVRGVEVGSISDKTTIIESSSGNLAVALGKLCNVIHLPFIAVIDKNINYAYEKELQSICLQVIKINDRDSKGGYLLNRIKTVKDFVKSNNDFFWTNQYENDYNYLSYYRTLGSEINESFDELSYIFVAVSSAGTISGVSKRVKEKFKNVKIIAVDIEGSEIFGSKISKRFISGLGSSIRPVLLKHAMIDDVVHVTHEEICLGCMNLLQQFSIFAGGSSGAVFSAIEKYANVNPIQAHENVLFICADSGEPYADTIYNERWRKEVLTPDNLKL